uniref:Uncharacterized protein n=1 Tax=Ralstonia solanacearum CFBP2957 TaxID=859656 RepID=D8P3A6_RALSL|nr:protein of unknown function [Ralstonia solanacearum CFBP2957]
MASCFNSETGFKHVSAGPIRLLKNLPVALTLNQETAPLRSRESGMIFTI